MSDFERLKAMLAKLSARERAPGEGRKLKGGDAEALLSALVTEIDETILPRRLTLVAGSVEVHLAVANRRLQALIAPAPATDGGADLEGQPLPDAEDPGVPALKDLLLKVFANGGAVEVRTRRLETPFASDIGVLANLLARAWGVSDVAAPKAATPEEVMTTFLGGLDPSAAAWLRINGEEVTDQGGDETRVASLGEQAAIFLDGYFAKFEDLFSSDAPACGTLVGPRGAGEAMLFVEIGEESAFVAAPLAELTGIAQVWQSLVAE